MPVDFDEFDYIIVGSGPGGATLAKELSKKSDKILVIERGREEKRLGTFLDAARFYDADHFYSIKKSKEGIILWNSIMAGGSGFVSCGNMIRSMSETFMNYGINLEHFFLEAEKELKVAPIDERLISDGSRAIAATSGELGWPMIPLSKAIDPIKCIRCGNCTFGCKTGAKWTPCVYLNEGIANGVNVLFNSMVERVEVNDGSAAGVTVTMNHEKKLIKGKKIILCAGGFGTPVILQKSGFKNAGNNLFVDYYVNVYGIHEKLNMKYEPQMTYVYKDFHASKGFILSTSVNHSSAARFIEAGFKGRALPDAHLLGIMVKIKDDNIGTVFQNGQISKMPTEKDWMKINVGTEMAKEILIKTGVSRDTIVLSKPQGAHPGGTAGIGKVVNHNLETEIKNLYVCDASVFPDSSGLPPILTIIALAKWLAIRL